jgi:hypothetical protein
MLKLLEPTLMYRGDGARNFLKEINNGIEFIQEYLQDHAAMLQDFVGSQPNFFRLLSKAAYTPCRITTNHCRIVLMDIHLIFAIITIQYRPSFSQLQV